MEIKKLNGSQKKLLIVGVAVFMVVLGSVLFVKDGSKGIFYNPDANIKIVKSEASKIEFEDYKTNEFSIKKPIRFLNLKRNNYFYKL